MPSRLQFVLALALALSVVPLHSATAANRPNILWLTTEDMSPNLGCYGDADANTPRLDAFSRQAVRYTHAFATAPVCSPSRSCLITGVYATSLGTQRLRSHFPIPPEFRPFPAYLREAGYYCTNNVKTDYNLADEAAFIRAAWDESSPRAHWRFRKSGQPFFAVFNCMTTHQSRTSAWPHEQFEREVGSRLSAEQRHDPSQLTLPSYYPDRAEARRAWARYHDCITAMDAQVGEILDQLAADGLSEDTIVFFFSDHGMGMPRGKRCLFDSGLHVPLLVRFPEKFAHLAPGKPGKPGKPGTTSDRLVSFVDFAPTILRLAGIEPPQHFQGSAFLGEQGQQRRDYVYGARDRVDEAFDVARSVRDDRWLYIHNFMPHLSWMQPEFFSDTSTFRQELKRLAAAGKLPPACLGYAAPRRAVEELYDTQADPHQLENLAGNQEHQQRLQQMRGALRRWQLETRDAGFLTEPQMWAHLKAKKTPWNVAHDEQLYPLERLLDAAASVGNSASSEQQLAWLRDPNDGTRYWAAVGLTAQDCPSAAAIDALQVALGDPSPVVRIESAAMLARHGEGASAIPVLMQSLDDRSPEVALHAARALQLLGPLAQPARQKMEIALARAREQESQGDTIAMFIRFSLEAALAGNK